MRTKPLQVGIASLGFVSLLPYFMWHNQKVFYAVATFLVVIGAALSYKDLVLDKERIILSAGFALFFVYLSFLPKMDGPPTRWFLLIPFTAALIHLSHADLEKSFSLFHWIFAISLLPGMAVWAWLVLGFPLEMNFTTPPGAIVQRGVTEYAELPGAVLLLANGIVMPHGGILFRLCGVYDEPGTVGTVAALVLAATRYRFDAKGTICFVAGVLSMSIAFALLTFVGLALTAIKRPKIAPAALLSLIAAVPLIGLTSANGPSNLTLRADPTQKVESAPWVRNAISPPLTGRFTPHPAWSLRNSPFNNRDTSSMRALLREYMDAPLQTKLFGIAIDASSKKADASNVWYRLITDFGAVGFIATFLLFALPVYCSWKQGSLDAVFVLIFLMSFYQRPLIWMPAQLLIYLYGVRKWKT
jgi:hypothetical protein